jgi:hypothetical protein
MSFTFHENKSKLRYYLFDILKIMFKLYEISMEIYNESICSN